MTPTIAYLDPASGIAGDMFLGCLVSAGWRIDALRETIHALAWTQDTDQSAWSVAEKSVMKGAFHATLIDVQATEAGQPHRHLSDIQALLENSKLPFPVIDNALAVFQRLAVAEGAVHGINPNLVHFHEVGALDSIIDVVGVCAGLHALGLTLYSAPLPMGHGYTQSDHGMIPLPAPATLELLARANAPVKPAPGPGELVTPTGAALVIHFTQERWFQPDMRLSKIGVGAGTYEFAWANVARLWVGDPFNARRVAFQAATAATPATHDHAHGHAHPHPHEQGAAHTHSHDHTPPHHHDHSHAHSHDATPTQGQTPTTSHDHSHAHGHGHSHSHPHAYGQTGEQGATQQPTHAAQSHAHGSNMSLLETNIDDMNPEFYAAVSEKLFANGARDVWYSSIFMKKNRPGIKLSVLVRQEDEARLAALLLRESTTLGMRVLPVGRYEAQRRMESVSTPYGDIAVKLKIIEEEIVGAVPEYEPCKAAAQTHGVSTREVYETAAAVAWWTFIAPKHGEITG